MAVSDLALRLMAVKSKQELSEVPFMPAATASQSLLHLLPSASTESYIHF